MILVFELNQVAVGEEMWLDQGSNMLRGVLCHPAISAFPPAIIIEKRHGHCRCLFRVPVLPRFCAAMDDDYADLLGSSSMPVRQTVNGRSWSTVFLLTMAGAIGGMVLYVGLVYLWNLLMKSREKSYKLSMRRHHGIPDSDHRPFTVAYAAARRAREEKEKPPKKQPVIEPRPVQPPQSRPDQALRQRPIEQITRSTSENVPWPGSSRFPGQYYSNNSVATSHVPPTSIAAPNLSRVTFVDGWALAPHLFLLHLFSSKELRDSSTR
ncbi:hypothetical protein BDZ89DRAFT_608511 [Hymenopellis radicata]|nr:hypothetical protein BDZ89DRAFT_608511 [Hymenopellis radicata]